MDHHIALYFAYGSNMNNRQMRHRCPNADNLGHAVLEEWALAERKYADIERDEDATVEGVLWAVTADCLESLDQYEGYPSCYTRAEVEVSFMGTMYPAVVYFMTPQTVSARRFERFPAHYAKACIDGAERNGVPVDALYENHLPAKFHPFDDFDWKTGQPYATARVTRATTRSWRENR